MPEPIMKKRMTRLENLMAHLIQTVERTDEQLARTDEQITRTERQMELTQQRLNQLSADMQNFKDELQQDRERFSAAMQRDHERFSAEMRQDRERFSAEMRQNHERFSAAMQQDLERYKQESRAEIRAMNKKWGELSNKMGTMAEDLVAPSIGRILRQTIGGNGNDLEYLAVRVRKRHPITKQNQEYDVVAVCGDYMLINETKSSLRPRDVENFVSVLSQAREFFPEYASKSIIGALGSLYVDDSLVRRGEKAGLIVLGFGEDVMEVLNQPGFVPKVF